MMDANLRYLIGVVAVVGLIVLVARNPKADDVRWTRQTFEALVSGRASAQSRLAWERLQAMGVDVGATYTALPNAREQAQYRRAFFQELANGFRRTGARPEAFVGWRMAQRSDEAIVVAADYPANGRTLLLTVSSSGKKQIESIQWAIAD